MALVERSQHSVAAWTSPESPYPVHIRDQKTITTGLVELQLESPELPKTVPIETTILKNEKTTPGLFITGLGAQYPPNLMGPDGLDAYTRRWYDVDNSPG